MRIHSIDGSPSNLLHRTLPVHENKKISAARATALTYEGALQPVQRKRLGQFFTGLPLGKLLAHLALRDDAKTILDPMAGHGDLLDAMWEAAEERGLQLEALKGIEIDSATAQACRDRLNLCVGRDVSWEVVAGDAFDPRFVVAAGSRSYDLVITNPPYVRYQGRGETSDNARRGLISIIDSFLEGIERRVWRELAEEYSGLADISVPAWLLAAALVRPGGRLAVVAPATWRSRDYGDVVRYLLLRCFTIECVVEDRQPGWFSDALVRTHLIVGRRLSAADIGPPLSAKCEWPKAALIEVDRSAAAANSLVGSAFRGTSPEIQFATWVRDGKPRAVEGARAREFDLRAEWLSLEPQVRRRRWYRRLEGSSDLPLLASARVGCAEEVPEVLRELLPAGATRAPLITLENSGIEVGQGLRTGCNSFFYVTALGPAENDTVLVEASCLFDRRRFAVPREALRPVLRRQAEIQSVDHGQKPDGRALDLRKWILPEDSETVFQYGEAYAASGEPVPSVMPRDLATYVRSAARLKAGSGQPICELSAVRTNIRRGRANGVTPRFWYMLPDFAPRHLPMALIPRINHRIAAATRNLDPPLLIDANFSTLWPTKQGWTPYALCALLNSAWCRAFMEDLGTPLGGGALKLEATHLRRMLVPDLSANAREALDSAARRLWSNDPQADAEIDEIVLSAILREAPQPQLAKDISDRTELLSSARQRTARPASR
ncbi:MAG: N-6 DNA methylase [Alphaproteobacteria bacterium]|nr:N-6 DNA methylase [Alphaproteobacteria bacterium]